MTRWRDWLSSGPASTPPLARASCSSRLGLQRAPPPAGQLLGQVLEQLLQVAQGLLVGTLVVVCHVTLRRGPRRHRGAGSPARRRARPACRASIASTSASRRVRSGGPERQPERDAPHAGRQLGAPVVALDRRPARAARRRRARSTSSTSRAVTPFGSRSASTRSDDGRRGQRREPRRPAGRRVEQQLEAEQRSGPGRRVGGERSRPRRRCGPRRPGQPIRVPSTCTAPPGIARATAASNWPFRSQRSNRSLPGAGPVRRLPLPGQHRRPRAAPPGAARPAAAALNDGADLEQAHVGHVVGPVALHQAHQPGQQPAAEIAIVARTADSAAGRCRRRRPAPSGSGETSKSPCSTMPAPHRGTWSARSGASGSVPGPERAQVGRETSRSRAAGRSPRSGPSPGRRSGRQPGTSTAIRPSSGLETTVAPMATQVLLDRAARAARRRAPGSRAPGRRKMRGGCAGPGQRSSGASGQLAAAGGAR